MGFNSAFKGLNIYIGRSKSICAPYNCIVIIKSPETFWSHFIAVQYEMERLSIKWPAGNIISGVGFWKLAGISRPALWSNYSPIQWI